MNRIYILLFVFLFNSCKKEITLTNLAVESSLFDKVKEIVYQKDGENHIILSGGKKTVFTEDELPLKTAMIVPTSAIAYLDALNLLEHIKGVSEVTYIYNPAIQEKVKEKTIVEIGTYNELYIEPILAQKPDIFISTSNPMLAKFHSQLEVNGIKIIYIDEYKESHPLAKSEYIKLFGVLFGKEKEAKELYKTIETNYISIQKTIADNLPKKPSVFTNGMYGDVWHMSGGKSFQAIYLEDAGADYLWKGDNSTNIINLSFEEVYEKARKAEFWVNIGDFTNLKTLSASYPKYEWFNAIKTGHVYSWGKRKNLKGANDYFETGIVRSDWILKDLASIFHPDLFPNHTLYYYQKLE